MVAGHVDDTGELVSVKQDDNAVWFTIKAPENIMKYCIEKGSIALDGISLTIAKLSDDTISVSMIPHTIKIPILDIKNQEIRSIWRMTWLGNI